MTKVSKSLAQPLDAESNQTVLQRLPSRPAEIAALQEAQRQRTAATTYNYLFSSEVKAPD